MIILPSEQIKCSVTHDIVDAENGEVDSDTGGTRGSQKVVVVVGECLVQGVGARYGVGKHASHCKRNHGLLKYV